MTIAPAFLQEYPALNDAQRSIVGHVEGPLLVIAGPGSGKTLSLVLRSMNLLPPGAARFQDLAPARRFAGAVGRLRAPALHLRPHPGEAARQASGAPAPVLDRRAAQARRPDGVPLSPNVGRGGGQTLLHGGREDPGQGLSGHHAAGARHLHGKRLLERLAKDLSARLGRGFGYSNLNLIRQVYLTYQDRHPNLQSLIGESPQGILQTATGELPIPADAGQMNLYLNYLRENETLEGEEPPIGLILCTEKDEAVVHYALGGLSNKVFASRYQLQLPAPEILQREIEAERRRLEQRLSLKRAEGLDGQG